MTEEQLARLKQLATRFTETDKSGLRQRWEFGKEALPLRGAKRKLSQVDLTRLIQETGVSRREIQYCLKFAERYPTPEDCETAITQYPSWTRLVHEGLYNKKDKAQPTTVRRDARLLKALSDLQPEDVKDPRDFGQRLVAIGQVFLAAAKRQAA